VVDDQTYNLEAMQIILKYRVGISEDRVDIASSGEKAVEMVAANLASHENGWTDYDLILMDCNMPRMDGYETTDLIRSLVHRH